MRYVPALRDDDQFSVREFARQPNRLLGGDDAVVAGDDENRSVLGHTESTM